MDDVLQNLSNVVSIRAQEKELEFLIRIAPDVPLRLVGDPLRIGQILTNLSNNAVKFTERGEIVIEVSVVEIKDRALLRFSVRDTGIGMTEEQIERVFQAFTQADASTTRKYGGTGLGLTICKHLAELMGGELRIESEYGQGSTFVFQVSLQLSAEEDATSRLLLPEGLSKARVLLVDDNEMALHILRDILRSFKIEPTLAVSGPQALSILETAPDESPYKLVLLDWKMPGMDGIEAARSIKESPRIRKKPALVLITPYGREDIIHEAEQLGLDGLLFKPISQSALFNAIMESVGGETLMKAKMQGGQAAEDIRLKAIRGARILVVEDNDINQQVAFELLGAAGMAVTIASNGKEAVDLADQREFDLIFMDIQMPVMDGFEATRVLRNDERFRNVPIVAMTAHAMRGDREKSLAAGMDDHLSKPIDPHELFSMLFKWIKTGEREESPLPVEPIQEADGAELPESIPGVDMGAGLARVSGNKALYRDLLLQLRSDYVDYAGEMALALEGGDGDKARLMAHTLKGIAGTLGVSALQGRAAAVETALRNDAPPEVFPALLKELEVELASVVRALQVLGEPSEKGAVRHPGAGEGGEDVLLDALKRMEPHLRARKPKRCSEVLEEVAARTWSPPIEAKLKEIVRLIASYKFKDAILAVDTLIAGLEPPG